jgi:hypothetical protein
VFKSPLVYWYGPKGRDPRAFPSAVGKTPRSPDPSPSLWEHPLILLLTQALQLSKRKGMTSPASDSNGVKERRLLPSPPPKPASKTKEELPGSSPVLPRFPSPPSPSGQRAYQVSGKGSYRPAPSLPLRIGEVPGGPPSVPTPPGSFPLEGRSSLPQREAVPRPTEPVGVKSLTDPAQKAEVEAAPVGNHLFSGSSTTGSVQEGQTPNVANGRSASPETAPAQGRVRHSIAAKPRARRNFFKLFTAPNQDGTLTFLSAVAALASWLTAILLILVYLDVLR